MKSLASRVGVLALLLAPAHAAVLLSSQFTGNTLTGISFGNLSWNTDTPGVLTGPSSVTLSSPIGSTLEGAVLNNAATNDRIGGHVNVQTVTGGVGVAAWQADFVVGYTLAGGTDTIELSGVTLTAYAVNLNGAIQGSSNPRTIAYAVEILDSTLTTTFATGYFEQTIPGASNNGVVTTIELNGDTSLQASDLGGATGSFILRISAPKTSASQNGAFTQFDNLSLNGNLVSSAPIPEPTIALLGGWGALLLLRRRR